MRRLVHEHTDVERGSTSSLPESVPVPAVLERVHGFIGLCRDERLLYINPSGARMLGYQLPEEAVGRGIDTFFHPEYRGPALDLAGLAEETNLVSMKFVRRDGSEVDVEVWVTRLREDAHPVYMVEARDISEHVRVARALAEREQRLNGILNTVADGILTLDMQGVVGSFNRACEEMFGYATDEVVGHNVHMLLDVPTGGHLATDPATGWPLGLEPQQEWTGRRKGGDTFPIEVSIKQMKRGEQVAYTCIVRDITARKEAARRIQYMAHYDTLTGLPNRHLFMDRLDEALKRAARSGKSVAMMFVDLDDFKAVNDTLGHEAGDAVLRDIARRFEHCVRESDTVARLGGDEFVILLEELEEVDNAGRVAQTIVDSLARPVSVAEREFVVGASIGIAVYPDHARTVNDLMHCADEAMYAVKDTGRNAYRFYGGGPEPQPEPASESIIHRLGWGKP